MELQNVWFFLWGLLWSIYFITDGFDLGIGVLLPFLGKSEGDRRVMLNAMGPLWDGNEVWLITAGGVTFAAFPLVYAVMFSSLYSALMLVLFGLIVRGVSFEFRSKVDSDSWRRVWDGCMVAGSLLPAVLLGAAFANIFRGLPIDGQGVYHGSLLTLLNPYGLLGGVLFLLLFMVHGAIWLAAKTDGDLQARAAAAAKRLWIGLLFAAGLFLAASHFATRLWNNFVDHPALMTVVVVAVLGLVAVLFFLETAGYWKAWFASAVTIVATTFFGVIGLFPRMFPSTLDPAYTLTAHNASSSPLTLKIMLIVAVIFVPIVLAYQIWAYTLFKGKVTEEEADYGEVY